MYIKADLWHKTDIAVISQILIIQYGFTINMIGQFTAQSKMPPNAPAIGAQRSSRLPG